MAKIISSGEFVEGIGGGVCQVSTTLYNTAVKSGVVGITNRQHHSLPVHYVPLGLDAMVSSVNDLSFVNLSLSSIFIIGKTDGYRITFEFYGQKQNYRVKLNSVVDKVLPFTVEEITDTSGSLASGERRVLIEGKIGYKVSSYRNYYENEKLVKTELISVDYYAPKKSIVLIGK
jgi:vancomycin resistance protein YoaR